MKYLFHHLTDELIKFVVLLILTASNIYVLASLLSNTTWIWNSLLLIWYVLLAFQHSPTNTMKKECIILILTYKYGSVTNLFSSSSSQIFYKTVLKIMIKVRCKYARKNQFCSIQTQVSIIQKDSALDNTNPRHIFPQSD
jgi:hypothetical protein